MSPAFMPDPKPPSLEDIAKRLTILEEKVKNMECKGCGKFFDSTNDQNTFHSEKCNSQYHLRLRREKEGRHLRIFTCPVCSDMIETYSTTKKYCSLWCSIEAQKATAKAKRSKTP
jgi:transcription initiation factor IIE alpha subunit